MKEIAILFAIGVAPLVSVTVLAYLIGRSDGRRAEHRRRELAARGLVPIRDPKVCTRL